MGAAHRPRFLLSLLSLSAFAPPAPPMDNQSICFLLLVLLALAAQLLLFALGRRLGLRPWPLMLIVLASSGLTAWLGHHRLPEQLPICTDSLLTYLHCLGL